MTLRIIKMKMKMEMKIFNAECKDFTTEKRVFGN